MTIPDLTGDDVTKNLTNYDCLHIGYNYKERVKARLRWRYQDKTQPSAPSLSDRVQLCGTHSPVVVKSVLLHAATTAYSTNGQTAKYIYIVCGWWQTLRLYLQQWWIVGGGNPVPRHRLGETITAWAINLSFSGGDEFNYLMSARRKVTNTNSICVWPWAVHRREIPWNRKWKGNCEECAIWTRNSIALDWQFGSQVYSTLTIKINEKKKKPLLTAFFFVVVHHGNSTDQFP